MTGPLDYEDVEKGREVLGKAFRILMVDDDEDDIFAVHRGVLTLESEIDFVAASNSEEAFAHLKKQASDAVDLIILDVNIPRINGFEILTKLKSVAKWRDIPVMMLSTSENEIDSKRANDLGAVSFTTKFSSMKTLNKWANGVEKFLQAQS